MRKIALLSVCLLSLLSAIVWWPASRDGGPETNPRQVRGAPAESSVSDEQAAPDPESAPSAAAPASEERDEAARVVARMRHARDCYRAGTCEWQASDPRSHYFRAGAEVARGLRTLAEMHRAGQIRPDRLAAAVREFLGMDNGHVREAAIDALGDAPVSRRNLDALLAALDNNHDAELMTRAMPELARYQAAGFDAAIDAFFQRNLETGGHYAAQVIAEGLLPFLDRSNVDRYRTLAARLPPKTRKARLLKQTLAEWQRLRSGA